MASTAWGTLYRLSAQSLGGSTIARPSILSTLGKRPWGAEIPLLRSILSLFVLCIREEIGKGLLPKEKGKFL